MAPGGGGKRKRGDRFSSDGREDGSRPSPHRPGSLTLAQQGNDHRSQPSPNSGRDQYDQRGGGRRRGNRGGRGGGSQRSPVDSPNSMPLQARPNNITSKPLSPTIPSSPPPTESKVEPVQQSPTIAAPLQQPLQKQPVSSAPYQWDFLTDVNMTNWSDGGREHVLDAGVATNMEKKSLVLGQLYQELIKSVLDGRLDGTEAGLLIKSILGSEMNIENSTVSMADKPVFDAASLFLDNLSIYMEALVTPFSSLSTAGPLRNMVIATSIPLTKMRLELDSVLLENLGMIRNTFVRVGIRQQTNLLYRQSNYNLLREETEGYSKLMTEFFTTSSNEPSTNDVVEETFERVKGMIGSFDLDVGRVLDITLDVFAAVLVKQYRFFVKYLRASSWWPQEKASTEDAHEQASNSLPRWATPGFSSRPLSDPDKEETARLKSEHDEAFWQRTRNIGMAAFFELGGRKAEEEKLAAALKSASGDLSQDSEGHKWIEFTKTLPPPGNKVAAQVLGFKLRFYSSSARDSADVLPLNLIYLAALLIKVGFISLRDLYPHIWPEDSAMENIRDEKMKEKSEREKSNRPGGASNALLAAGALPDDTIDSKTRDATRIRELDAARRSLAVADATVEKGTSTPQPEDKAEQLPEPSEQKVQLLKSLLAIGALPEALYILGRFPWLPEAFPDLPEYIHRIVHYSLSKVYEPLRPLRNDMGLREQQKIPDPDQAGAMKGEVKLIDTPARKTMRWAQLDKEDTNEGIDYKFYWDDWADNIPICQTVDDVFTLCSTLVNYTGVKIGQDPLLLIKLARIGRQSLATDTSDSNMTRWIDLSKRLIVPAMSFTKCNPGVVHEVFELIKNFSTATRYNIYAEWYTGQISRLPEIKSAFEQAKAETKDVLKRISKTTIKIQARALAKVAYANPGVVFQVAIAQLESYENIVDAVVECARYFTYLAYDVLTWSLMSALGGTGRTRVQADGMLTSKWLAALSLFAGKVFKRYSVLNSTPIVQYVADQLRRGNSTDLIILEEITKSMAGIISDTNYNDAQVLAMSGGETLQAQILLQLLDRRHESKTTARRLIKSLTESGQAGQLLIALAQERQTGIFKIEEQNAHPKLLGNLFDQLHRILVQYLDLLRSNLSVKDFDFFVPGIGRLITEFGIEPGIAFWISRASIATAITEYDTRNNMRNSEVDASSDKEIAEIETQAMKTETMKNSDEKKETENSGETQIERSQPDDSSSPAGDESNLEDSGAIMQDADVNPSAKFSPPPVKIEAAQDPWHPVLQEVMTAVRPALPKEIWEVLSLPFYVAFWQHSLPQVYLDLQSYDDEINRLTKKVLAINSDRSDISVLGTQRKEKEKKAISDIQERLRVEMPAQFKVYQQHRNRNLRESKIWFENSWGKWEALNLALIEHCFFPRAIMSPLDAMYVFRMLKFLHSSGTPNFRTMGVYDQIFNEKRLISMIFLCTAKEAECFGRFLNEMLREFGRWHADKLLYEKEAFGREKDLPGFSKKLSQDQKVVAFLDYEEFRRLLLKWHRGLTSAIKACISSDEYMHIRNAINVLNNVHQNFPAVNWMGQSLVNSITDLGKSETREDLKIAAMSLIGALKKREKDWMIPQAFNLAPVESGNTNGKDARSTSAKPATPGPDIGTNKPLNPKAPDYEPSPRTSVNTAPKMVRTASGKLEVEDGEIEDAKMSEGPTVNETGGTADTQMAETPPAEAPKTVQPTKSISKAEEAGPSRRDSPTPSSGPQPSNGMMSSLPNATAETNPRTPSAANYTTPLPQSELNRTASSTSSTTYTQHSLPNKPDLAQPRHGDYRIPSRSNDRGGYEHLREPRFPERTGPERPREPLRDRPSERSASGPHLHGYERASERLQQLEGNRIDPRWGNEKAQADRPTVYDQVNGSYAGSRDTRPPSREERLEQPPGSKSFPEQHQSRWSSDDPGQQIRKSTMPPPRPNIPQHPDRAAMIQGSQGPDRGFSANVPPDHRSEATRPPHQSYRGPRGPSPTQADERRFPRYDSRTDDRPSNDSRHPVEDPARLSHPRYEDSQAPTGPRTGRPANLGSMHPTDRFKESMKPSHIMSPIDPNHGRLSNESNFNNRQTDRQVESQYGRLTSESDIPSGPRLPNGNHPPPIRGGRNISAPQPHINTQQSMMSPQSQQSMPVTQERQTLSGPSMRTSPRKSAPAPFLPNTTSSTPSTPVIQSPETANVHPDRLKALQGSGIIGSDAAPQNRVEQTGPSRIPQPSMAMPTGGPPRGPNNQLPSPIGPPTTNRGPPTGPALPHDRNGRDKRFAGIQNMLQQVGTHAPPERSGQGASIRGRGGRINSVNLHSPLTSGPPTPGMPRQDQPVPREDLFAGRPNGLMNPHQSQDDSAYDRGGRRGGPREGTRDGDRRTGRYRSRSPDKDRLAGAPTRVRDEEGAQGREGLRDHPRSNEGMFDRDSRGGAAPNEMSIRGTGGPDMREGRSFPRGVRRNGRDEGQYREHRGEFDARDGPERRDERDRREPGGSGRKRGRVGDDAAAERHFLESKRPRR